VSHVVGLVVEGHGEVQALPVLVRRVAEELGISAVRCLRPFRVPRGKLVREEELRRAIDLVARKAGSGMPILVLLDADDDCPAELGPRLQSSVARDDRVVEVVLAKTGYESWFLAAAASLSGARSLPTGLDGHPKPEEPRYPKAWLDQGCRPGTPRIDQAPLTQRMDLRAAASARSFRKLLRALAVLLGVDPPSYALDAS
jgi:hypothetical protein